MIRKLLLTLIAGLGLSGCISAQSHPDRWAQVATAPDGCAAIAGRYRNAGESAAMPYGQRAYAGRTLLGAETEGATAVQIAYADVALTIRAYREDEMIAEKTFSAAAGNLDCGLDGVSINGKFGVVGPAENLLMVGAGGSSITLYRLSDGALLVKSSGHAVALVFLVPMVAGETQLYRFAALD